MSSTSVRFGKGELESFQAAAKEARLPFNQWVRRACREAAALEKAVDGLSERDGGLALPVRVSVAASSRSESSFQPDFK